MNSDPPMVEIIPRTFPLEPKPDFGGVGVGFIG